MITESPVSGVALVTASLSPRVGGEAEPRGASSTTDVADEGARGHGFRAGLGSRIFPSSALFCCVGDAVVLKMSYTGEAGFPQLCC